MYVLRCEPTINNQCVALSSICMYSIYKQLTKRKRCRWKFVWKFIPCAWRCQAVKWVVHWQLWWMDSAQQITIPYTSEKQYRPYSWKIYFQELRIFVLRIMLSTYMELCPTQLVTILLYSWSIILNNNSLSSNEQREFLFRFAFTSTHL